MIATGPIVGELTIPARTFASSPHLSDLLTLTGRLVQERIAHRLGRLGISYAQAVVLVRLWRCGGQMPQSEMIQALALSRASGTLVLNQLQKQGLVERLPDHGDARRFIIRLTKPGQDLEQPVLEVFELVESAIRGPLSATDVETSFRVLVGVLQAMQGGRRR